jgi:hypothetical protein
MFRSIKMNSSYDSVSVLFMADPVATAPGSVFVLKTRTRGVKVCFAVHQSAI